MTMPRRYGRGAGVPSVERRAGLRRTTDALVAARLQTRAMSEHSLLVVTGGPKSSGRRVATFDRASAEPDERQLAMT
jgi:hypothetical protein